MSLTVDREVRLSDRYTVQDGTVFMTGLQALVRLPMDQNAIDLAAGRRTATLISGYEGSPLAGYDLEMQKQASLLTAANAVVRPSVNEELAANAVQGSQLASAMASRKFDGVVGIWYGKAPGLDRASDAIRHANLGGTAPNGGVLALVGDDSVAKSSTVPSSSEAAMAELGMPILAPADPHDILSLGLHGIAMSRICGLWVGMKLATNVVDGSGTVTVEPRSWSFDAPDVVVNGTEYRHEVSANFLQPNLTKLEQSLFGVRLELARRYIVENDLCTTAGDRRARMGIIAAGATHRDTVQALHRLGIDASNLDESGVRVLKLGAVHPLDPRTILEFADGLEEIVVVEEKRSFVELAVKDILFGASVRPAVLGRRDESGATFLRADSDLPPEYLARQLASRFAHRGIAHSQERTAIRSTGRLNLLPIVTRTPYFCSGCPHNRSTQVPEGSLVGAGIGCHGIAALMPSSRVGDIIGLCQMGGEGAAWIGMAPFVSETHLIQNLGDGTFHHSGSLAIRASIAAGSNITYKLLYNDAVAMTGGQQAVGKMSVPSIVAELLAEGARKIVITTDDVRKYKAVRLPRSVDVLDRSKLIEVQEQLSQIEGVTVLIHDQECATELRRKRKRRLVSEPVERIFVNERVCEGCGDCGQKSNCMSVQHVDTAFGPKTRIDQASCNKDYSCVDGDCPSFVSVVPVSKSARKSRASRKQLPVIPEPSAVSVPDVFGMRLAGMGGTGVVTTAQIISTAATLDGAHVLGLDQLGLAQKGGAVVSDILISRTPQNGSNKLTMGSCDLYLGCDMLVAADERHLAIASTERTVACVSSSQVPTGAMVLNPDLSLPGADDLETRIRSLSKDSSVFADTRRISRAHFGTDQFANTLLVGMAFQLGALPLERHSIEQAITLNGVAVESNLEAFAIGRRIIVDPGSVGADQPSKERPTIAKGIDELVALLGDEASEHTRESVARLSGELVAYQSARYGRSFVSLVESIREREASRLGTSGAITDTFATSLYKLMAYKDEYEVARLFLDPEFEASVRAEFGTDVAYSYKLHPPFLRAIGYNKKVTLGPWFRPAFTVLRAARHVRGTVFDPFGYAHVRRVERDLVDEFVRAMTEAVVRLTASNAHVVAEIAALPEAIKGYESIKLKNVTIYREHLRECLAQLGPEDQQ